MQLRSTLSIGGSTRCALSVKSLTGSTATPTAPAPSWWRWAWGILVSWSILGGAWLLVRSCFSFIRSTFGPFISRTWRPWSVDKSSLSVFNPITKSCFLSSTSYRWSRCSIICASRIILIAAVLTAFWVSHPEIIPWTWAIWLFDLSEATAKSLFHRLRCVMKSLYSWSRRSTIC